MKMKEQPEIIGIIVDVTRQDYSLYVKKQVGSNCRNNKHTQWLPSVASYTKKKYLLALTHSQTHTHTHPLDATLRKAKRFYCYSLVIKL